MIGSLIINRRRSFSITRTGRSPHGSSENLLGWRDPDYDSDSISARSISPSPLGKPQHHVCTIPIETPDSTRFANNFHSRILQKYPFLVEMFYWALNYVAYAMTKKTAAVLYGQSGHAVTHMAQQTGINILNFEHHSMFSIFFPISEVQVQGFFLGHKTAISFLNQIYSLVHIPGTVWYVHQPTNTHQS